MISTKGRYSVRILLDLAEHHNGGYIPMKEVAARQDISLKYIERLMPALKSAGLIDSVHGAGGGVPHPAGVAGILRHDAAVLLRHHAGGPDEHASGRQLRHLKKPPTALPWEVFCAFLYRRVISPRTAAWTGSGRRYPAAGPRWSYPRSRGAWPARWPPTAPRRRRYPPARPRCGLPPCPA